MKNVSLLFGLALCFGCSGPTPPAYYSISSEFSAGERETIEAAVDAWCEATGDCPELALDSERARFVLVDDLPEGERVRRLCPEGETCTVNGSEGRGRIRIARNRAQPDSLAALWRTAAHEWGHLCIEGHVPASPLMAAVQEVEGDLAIDAAAVGAWREGCH